MIRNPFRFVCAIAALALTNANALAEEAAPTTAQVPARIPVADFVPRTRVSDLLLSPDGKNILYQAVREGSTILSVMDAQTRKLVTYRTVPAEMSLEWYRWAGAGKVLFSVSQVIRLNGGEERVTRLFLLDLATSESRVIAPRRMLPNGDDVLWVARDGSALLMALRTSYYDYPSVYRFSLTDVEDKGTVVQRPMDGVWSWHADDAGVVRMGLGFTGSKVRVLYRSDNAGKFREVARIGEDDDDKLWDVRRIVSGSDQGYVIDKDNDGRVILQLFDFAKREKVKTVFRNPDWDIESATLDEDGKPLAVYFTDTRDRVTWLDPARAGLQASFERALKEEEVWISSRARDDSKMLIFAGGANDPGAIYLFDKSKRSLDAVTEFNPKLRPENLAKPQPVTYSARDGSKINAYLTLPLGRSAKGLPLLVMPHGGPYGVRDKLDFDTDVQFLANRGYAVLQPNYRGSGGYGEAFEKLGDGEVGRRMQDDLDDGMDWLVKQGTIDPARVCVIGTSYGGYAAIWAIMRNPERYRCAVSLAGVTDWEKQLRYDRGFFSRKGGRSWRDRVRGEDGKFDLDAVSPARHGELLKRPLLLGHGTDDSNVPFSQFKMMMEAAKKAGAPVEALEFEGEGHGLSKPENREKWYEAIEAFLAKHNPADRPSGHN